MRNRVERVVYEYVKKHWLQNTSLRNPSFNTFPHGTAASPDPFSIHSVLAVGSAIAADDALRSRGIVCGLNEVIIKKLCNCTLLSYDIILQLFNGEKFVIYISSNRFNMEKGVWWPRAAIRIFGVFSSFSFYFIFHFTYLVYFICFISFHSFYFILFCFQKQFIIEVK